MRVGDNVRVIRGRHVGAEGVVTAREHGFFAVKLPGREPRDGRADWFAPEELMLIVPDGKGRS